jgi:hypothetical protein
VDGTAEGAAGEGQAALLKLLAEGRRIGREVAERPELDADVPGLDHLVQEAVPPGLLVVVGVPDAPGVRRGAELYRHAILL